MPGWLFHADSLFGIIYLRKLWLLYIDHLNADSAGPNEPHGKYGPIDPKRRPDDDVGLHDPENVLSLDPALLI